MINMIKSTIGSYKNSKSSFINRNLYSIVFGMNEFAREIVDFDNKAKKIFFSLYQNFAGSAKQLDRQKDNNVFQQQQSKYLNTLKNQLENLAQDILNKNSSLKNINLLNKKLSDEINTYLNEFTQKSRSL